ncbi:LTA synthase family protein [Clostridium perfringens]|uniref:LTA synthase family protein n=1 Tax=Clostridium perfringens TaxID=1502 RepID=UPI0028E14414|nr:LTA synthase family protein [Clostridium perfringens]MDT9337726.1 LTA synthase family protein [Clostridium perfringens]MDT9345482.1 LTA synthase family protein [Clostridium perfringens]MDT9348725.1 LTA synthase family protein [Clostridium perfringens]MDT9354568.1 LTA synthase family protein [Clostridium perfringens]
MSEGRNSFLQKPCKVLKKCSFEILFYFIFIFKITVFCTMLKSNNGAKLNLGTAIGLISYESIYLLLPMIFISFAFLLKSRCKLVYLYILDLFISALLIFDLMYYRLYSSFPSIRYLLYPDLYNPLGKELFFFRGRMFLIIIDLILIPILFILIRKYLKYTYIKCKKNRIIAFLLIFIISTGYIFYTNYKEFKDNGEYAFGTEWTPSGTIFRNTPLGYHLYDIYKTFILDKDLVLSKDEKKHIQEWLNSNYEDLPKNKYFGKLKGKNLVLIQVESLEDFVIGRKVEGQDITPTLNLMLKNSYYFPNIYEQNLIGNSSDADFMVNTGMLPILDSATSFSYPVRNIETLPKILEKLGYTTASSHPEVIGNWNWGEVHKGLFNFQNIYDMYSFDYSEVVGFGMSDKSYLTQLATKAGELKEPFYLYTVTLTNHGPFEIDYAHTTIKIPSEIEGTLIGQYFKTVRYTDEAIKMFIDKLKEEGRFEDTVFVIYGDHAGPTKYYKNQLKDVNFDGNYWKLNEKKVPLIIYNPSIQGKTIETKGGLIDVMPTVSYLLGVNDSSLRNVIGRNLLNTNRNIVALPSGEVAGEAKSQDELNHVKQSYDISTKIIKSDYFKNNN